MIGYILRYDGLLKLVIEIMWLLKPKDEDQGWNIYHKS